MVELTLLIIEELLAKQTLQINDNITKNLKVIDKTQGPEARGSVYTSGTKIEKK